MESVEWLDDEQGGSCVAHLDGGTVEVLIGWVDRRRGWYPRVTRDDVQLMLIESKLTDLESAKRRSLELWEQLGSLISVNTPRPEAFQDADDDTKG